MLEQLNGKVLYSRARYRELFCTRVFQNFKVSTNHASVRIPYSYIPIWNFPIGSDATSNKNACGSLHRWGDQKQSETPKEKKTG